MPEEDDLYNISQLLANKLYINKEKQNLTVDISWDLIQDEI